MWEIFLFAIILLFINLIFIIKRIPLVGMLIGLFTILISIISFIPNIELPINTPTPYFSLFIIFISVINMLIQVIDMRK